MAGLRTRLTERLGLAHPILSAPMAGASGGALAAAVSHAGGLGLIGGGYGDGVWLDEQFQAAGNAPVGCGFITWALARQSHLLTEVLAHKPRLLMLSFGDPRPFAAEIARSGAMLACQCQTIAHVREAVEAGAALIIAQGSEAGGHGASRATLTLVPETADLLAETSPDTLLAAAGGIADGRGLAAALALGADGVLVGTRFWASREALVHQNFVDAAIRADGDTTIRSHAPDIARRLDWPAPFSIRVSNNAFIRRWQGRDAELAADADAAATAYAAALTVGDAEECGVVFGEAAGMIHDRPPAGEIIERMVAEAVGILRQGQRFIA